MAVFRTVQARRRLRAVALVTGAGVAGYLASLIVYPAPLVTHDTRVALVVGLPVAEAEKELTAQGFRVKVAEAREADPALPPGHVVWQEPPASLALPEGSVVELTLSGGPAPVTVPDVLQFDLNDARQVIAAAGLAVGAIDSVPASTDRGVVVSTRPAEGTPRPPGARVDLVVSRGPADVRVPDLTGMTEQLARQRIEIVGLSVGLVQTRAAGRARPGTILEQRPIPGVLLPRGARVDLTVADRRP
jgi:beta-lactam-binding protein with PASTA domain